MIDWTEYKDAHSRAVFKAFEEQLGPLMAKVAPDWLLHHMEIRRGLDREFQERVEIRLVIKPIGEARFGDPDADLLTGHKRLADYSRRTP
jgi:hypothetical protein